MKNFDDKPIQSPEQDKFGFAKRAKQIAKTVRAIANLKNLEGFVIAINGAWGSGKSSIANLVKHYLKDSKNLKIEDFSCWWIKGEESLFLEFFRHLYSVMDADDDARKAMAKFGSRILSGTSTFIGSGANLFLPGIGNVVSSGMKLASGLIEQEESLEAMHKEVSSLLLKNNSKKKFVIVIDDIDRLDPDEALLVFRLVKSVGRLPNVIFILTYDRILVESIITKKYPSSESHYLEKIVQINFEVPIPPQSVFLNNLAYELGEIWGKLSAEQTNRFRDVLFNFIVHEIKLPRDIFRISTAMKIAWDEIGSEVDPIDLLCIVILKLNYPDIHLAISKAKDRLTKESTEDIGLSSENIAKLYEKLFLLGLEDDAKRRVKNILVTLFPRLDKPWNNIERSGRNEYEKARRVCSNNYFSFYFDFSRPDYVLSKKEINELIENCDDEIYVKNKFLQAKSIANEFGGTQVSTLLEEIIIHADSIPRDKLGKFLAIIFSICDDLNIKADESWQYIYETNLQKVLWLTRSLILPIESIQERSEIIMGAVKNAHIDWLIKLADFAYGYYYPKEGQPPSSSRDYLTTKEDAEKLRQMALEKIEKAAADGSLINSRPLIYALIQWNELDKSKNHDYEKVKQWCATHLGNDESIITFASHFVRTVLISSGFGGASREVYEVSRRLVSNFFETEEFINRVNAVMAKTDPSSNAYKELKRFIDAWKRDKDIDFTG